MSVYIKAELMKMEENNKILIYTDNDGLTKIDVKLEEDTLWLTQAQMCELYQTSRTNIVEHIKHIYEEGELDEEATCRKFRQVRQEGERMINREIPFYNLDMIIALGYRVRSIIATRFRQWATLRLKEYITKGFTLDDERLKNWAVAVIGRNCWNAFVIYVPQRKCSTARCWKSMLQVLIMTHEPPFRRSSLKRCKTRYTLPSMAVPPQN